MRRRSFLRGDGAWDYLILAGLCEVLYASIILEPRGSRCWPSLYCEMFPTLSIYLLNLPVRALSLGLAYAIWVDIGTLGTVAYGSLFLGGTLGALKALCLVMIVGGVVGLKLVGGIQSI
ncbi:DMT family transporter [Pseudomonas aeruginosa]|uniref:DMT family transporter n=1 Tax=Pseudomonas aeruginosa TaxID=287 RepID=UPI003BF0423D